DHPLGITNLRIRGMWKIENTRKFLVYLHAQGSNKFELICIIPLANYQKINDNSRNSFEKMKVDGLNVEDQKVRDPNNQAK
ncbi:NgoPII family restriction endonuclease, partial [Francisella tularensis subsp. holarctica]|uniref:NgoPII family restriction endonuclease n=1 Tax=Francisella tularensis TaxID=263 RepID=UPI002381AD6D